ncbi:MAG TPA: hypothetical protein PKO06_11140, partial [Candidatus Ozemobacteraceae bacterium]|nr:hypothetical protein [Candidatus Ozemobacteraceae bacterium]
DGLEVIPLTIPYGVVKDLSKATYSYEPFSDLGQDGFATGTEYILKLGSGNSGKTTAKRILVPMDDGAQGPKGSSAAVSSGDMTNIGFLKAYGAAYWCLKNGYTPVEWLIGYRGGSFFLPDVPAIETKLGAMGVKYEKKEGIDLINDILKQCKVIELFNYPVVKVYSSQADADAVEKVIQWCEIPYTKTYDKEILEGALDACNWLHMHHEDFTGWTGGCERLNTSCYTYESYLSKTGKDNNQLCSYCRDYYFGYVPSKAAWGSSTYWGWNGTNTTSKSKTVRISGVNYTINWSKTACKNYAVRCAERATYTGTRWWSINSSDLLCKDGSERPMCQSAKEAYDLATTKGYNADATGYLQSRQWLNGGSLIKMDGTNPMPLNTDFIYKPNRVQLMKFDVVKKIMDHVTAGGYIFSQCFAPETLDMTIYHRRLYLDKPASPGQAKNYDECFAFSGFTNKCFCRKDSGSGMYYSSINSTLSGEFNPSDTTDPRCQNHGTTKPNFGSGHCDSFSKAAVKNTTDVMAYLTSNANAAQYVKGKYGNGEFCFAGGHYHNNIQSQRLVANNILLGALSTKELSEGDDTDYTGKQKNNYGVVDPDNVNAGGANDYRDRFMNGFSQPLTIGDRLMNESGNMSGPTDEAVDFRTEFDATATQTRRFVIVPIHDIPPEVGVNNTKNATASAIYDLQGTDHPNGEYKPASAGGYDFGASIRIIGFAKFEIIPPEEYARDGGTIVAGDQGDLGFYQSGQVRGKFVEWVIKPGEVPVPY